MKTYPNQKVIHIQKGTYEDNFLQVGNDEWQRAARELTGSAFKLYLYLAGNRDGYDLALSQKAVEDATGLSKNTYHRAVEELETKGYLSFVKGNAYAFSTSPSEVSTQNGDIPKIGIYPKWGEVSTQNGEDTLPKMGREIDKTYNIYNVGGEDSICPEKGEGTIVAKAEDSPERESFISGDGLPGRRIRDLYDDEAKEIIEKLYRGVLRADIEYEYGMRSGTITKDFDKIWKLYVYDRVNGKIKD